jgi:23S rRNA (uracil1939-C5)-methyltransferase
MNNSPFCRHFPVCGGCDLLNEKYARTLQNKETRLGNIFSTYRKVRIAPVLPSHPESHYRHKVQLPFGRSERGAVVGLLARNRQKVISQKECYIQQPHLTLIGRVIEKWASDNRYPPFDERRHNGLLRHLLLRRSSLTGEILMAISLFGPLPGNGEKSYAQLISLIQNELERAKEHIVPQGFAAKSRLIGVTEIIRKSKGNIVLDGKRRKVFGVSTMEEGIGKFRFSLAIDSFFQTNPFQIKPLYSLVQSHIEPDSHILDAYAGLGTIGLFISEQARSVICVEQNPQAVKSAKAAIAGSGKSNIKIFRADAGAFLLHKWKVPKGPSGIILDPPREGLTRTAIHGLLKTKADYIIYVSCDPESLKRDADLLARYYFLKSLEAVDMFPFTNHIETVAAFHRK